MKKNYYRKFIAFLLLFFSYSFYASNFTQTVSSTAETCSGNGSVTINIAGSTAGTSNFTYRIYNGTTGTVLTPNLSGGNPQITTAVTSDFTKTITGFTTGTYRVETTEVDGSNVKVVTNTFTIADQKKNMVVAVVADDCTGRKLTANLTQSSYGPYVYTLRDSNNNILETSPSTSATSYGFTNTLANGSYTVTVKDACGNQQIGTRVITDIVNSYDIVIKHGTQLSGCNTKRYDLQLRFYQNGNQTTIHSSRFPITVTFKLMNFPDQQTVTINNQAEATAFQLFIPFYNGQNNSFTMTVTDSCPFIFTKNFTDPNVYGLNAPYFDVNLSSIPNTCKTQFNLGISRIEAFFPRANGYKVTVTSTVPGFNASAYNSNFNSSGVAYFSDFSSITFPNVPAGNYTVTITDDCGRSYTRTSTQIPVDWQLRKVREWGSCTPGSSTVAIGVYDGDPNANVISKLTSFKIMAAPQAFLDLYNTTLPYNADSWIYSGTFTANQGLVFANALPAGNYTFQYTDECEGNVVKTKTIAMVGTILQSYSTTKNFTCTGVTLSSTLTSNYNTPVMYLQQYFPALGKWGYPQDPTKLYIPGTTIQGSGTGLPLNPVPGNIGDGVKTVSSTGNVTVNGSGHYRVILENRAWLNGIENGFFIITTNPFQRCQTVLEEFDVNADEITINNFIVVTCADGTNNLMIDASGVNLTYQIIEKDGVAFISPATPQTSAVFTNLAPRQYKVKVFDACGREKIINFFVTAPEKLPVIKGTAFCDAQPGKLYIEGYNYLSYQWFKNGVAIAGASGVGKNVLNFPSYNSATDAATYSVAISLPGTCLAKTLYYTIKANGIPPNAGTGQTVTLDINNVTAPINLFNYLTGPYDNSGIWKETSTSGQLSDYIWNATNLPTGTYTFTYTVNATCSGAPAVSTVTIILKGVCFKTPNTTGIADAAKFGITSLSRADSGNSNWPRIRSGAHMVLESKTKGFVLNRVANPETDIPAADLVDGMAVFDTTKQCLRIYVKDTATPSNSGWKCFTQPSCN